LKIWLYIHITQNAVVSCNTNKRIYYVNYQRARFLHRFFVREGVQDPYYNGGHWVSVEICPVRMVFLWYCYWEFFCRCEPRRAHFTSFHPSL